MPNYLTPPSQDDLINDLLQRVRTLEGAQRITNWAPIPPYTTGTRPSAVTAGKGAHIYDTTLNQPLWSNGAAWQYSPLTGAGAPVGTGSAGDTYYDTTNNRLWRSNGTAWIFERGYDNTKRPGVALIAASASIGAGLTVSASWTTETSDVDGWITAPSTTLTVPTGWGGCYAFTFRTAWSVSTSSDIELNVLVNGAAQQVAAGPNAFAVKSLSGLLHVAAGTTLVFQSFNGSAGAINMDAVLTLDWLYV